MVTNLRLSPEAAEAVRLEAERSGRSQQAVIREAIDRHLGLVTPETSGGEVARLDASGTVEPPRASYRRPTRRLRLPSDVTSADLLDRSERS